MKNTFIVANLTCLLFSANVHAQISLYGMTWEGGSGGNGTIFKIDDATKVTNSVYSWDDPGRMPDGELAEFGGKLYGTTQQGGSRRYGVIYSFDPSTNTRIKLYEFDNLNGSYPLGLFLFESKLYGLTRSGGASGLGVIFSFDPLTNTFSKLFDFNASVGSSPDGVLTAYSGLLYGVTQTGGASNFGTIFSFNTANSQHIKLGDFDNTNGRTPVGGLRVYAGKLYGLTSLGGSSGFGVLYAFDPNTNVIGKLADFTNQGRSPVGRLVNYNAKLYGHTRSAGINGAGTIVEFTPSTGVLTKVYDFSGFQIDGSPAGSLFEYGGLLYNASQVGGSLGLGSVNVFNPLTRSMSKVQGFGNDRNMGADPSGNFFLYGEKIYGTTKDGISLGTIFSINPTTNTFSKLNDFLNPDGGLPQGNLTYFNNKLYGVTSFGGVYGLGALFSIDPTTYAFEKLFDFSESSGSIPVGSLTELDGKLFGTASSGGIDGQGTIYSFEPSTATFRKIVDFRRDPNGISPPPNGRGPRGSLVQFGGRLYGMTPSGGSFDYGVIYSVDISTASLATVFDFSSSSGGAPNGSLISYDGKLYGLTELGGSGSVGTIFSFDPASSIYAKVFEFNSSTGNRPNGDLLEYQGTLYGMTRLGGENNNGTIFSFNPLTNSYRTLFSFNGLNGRVPFGSLVRSESRLYGMTYRGGSSDLGIAFYFDLLNESLSKVIDFNGLNGANPYGGFVTVSSCVQSLEICDGVDNDCDGLVDEGCSDTYFRTRSSGTWSDVSIWESSSDSITWNPAVRTPVQSDNTILLRNGHSIEFMLFNYNIDQLVVEQDAKMILKSGTNINVVPHSSGVPSIIINGELEYDVSGPIDVLGQTGAKILINGVLNMPNGGLRMKPGGIDISSSGTFNIYPEQGVLIENLVNSGKVYWKSGAINSGGQPESLNYGQWIDSSNGQWVVGKSRVDFKNWGVYRKLGRNSVFQSQNSRIVNRGVITGTGGLSIGIGDSSLNLGRIDPGNGIGELTLTFNQPNTLSELNIELGNGENSKNDILNVDGSLVLNGVLNVAELDNLPEGSYTIVRKVNTGAVTGAFTRLNLPANYSVQYMTDSVVLIKSIPVAPRNISISNPTAITEGDSGQKELKFVVRLNAVSTGIVRVNYATADSTATAGEDYSAMSGTISIPAGVLTDTIRVPILGDKLVEPVERFKVLLSNPVNGIITTGLVVGTINNDDVLPAISITNYTITEGTGRDSVLQVQVRITNAYPLPVTVNYATADSTATSGTDYVGASGTLTFAPGDTLEFIPVLIKGDGIDEVTEIVNINLTNSVNATLAATTRGRVTISDDDLLPAMVVSNISITEKDITDTIIQIPVRLNRRYAATVTINYSISDSTATNGLDYDGVSGTLTFLPGDTLEFIPINILGDRIDEPNEIIKLSYFGIVNATPASASSRVTITDNDVLPAVQFTNLSLPEGNSGGMANLSLQVRLSRAYPLPVTVSYATEDSTAINGDDYTGISGNLTFAPEETTQTISLPVIGDYITEGSEIIKLRFTSPVNATVSATPSRITLTNDDIYPTVTASAAALSEGNTGSLNQVITVRINKRYPLPVTVQLAASDLTAQAGLDYTTTSTTVTFPANGDTLQTVLVPILGDLLDEANETYRITLSNPQYGILGSGGLFTATITDNDPVPAIRVNDTTAAEADGLMTFRVRLSVPSGRNVTVNWAAQNGTALAGSDYSATSGGTLTFLPGETLKEVTIALLTDVEAESNETLSVLLSGAVNGTLTAGQGGDATGLGTILNTPPSEFNTLSGRQDTDEKTVESSLQVSVLPNPSVSQFTLKLGRGSMEPILLRVTDIDGRIVEFRRLNAGVQSVQLGQTWQNGTYVLEITQGKKRQTKQLVKLR